MQRIVIAVLALIVASGIYEHVHRNTILAQSIGYGATIPAGNGTPTSLGMPCVSGTNASAGSTSLYDDNSNSGNSIWKCRPTGWSAPFIPSVQFYNASGTTTSVVKCMAATTSSTATTGAYTFNIAPLGISTLLTVQTQSLSTTTSATGLNTAYITAASATSVSGTVNSGAILSLLGATIIPQATVTTVYGLFCGY